MLYTERAETAAVSRCTSHASAVSTPLGCSSKMRYKELVTRVEPHASALSLLESGEHSAISKRPTGRLCVGSASLGSDGLSLCSIALLSVELTGALDAAQLLFLGLTLSVATLQTVDRFFVLFFPFRMYTHTRQANRARGNTLNGVH